MITQATTNSNKKNYTLTRRVPKTSTSCTRQGVQKTNILYLFSAKRIHFFYCIEWGENGIVLVCMSAGIEGLLYVAVEHIHDIVEGNSHLAEDSPAFLDMKRSSVPYHEEEENADSVTIEFHQIPLSNDPEPAQSPNSEDRNICQQLFNRFISFICWCCQCRKGTEFEPLNSSEGRS